MQTLLRTFLAFLAKSIIARKKPLIIGVTGTVGKTTVTTNIVRLLEHAYGTGTIGYSPYHYNGEYGLPLTIIGAKTGGKNPIRWLWVACIALFRLIRPYPRIIVLEYGIDHPGEMEFLLSIARPNIAIITAIESNHLEQFGTLERYRQEKLKLFEWAKYCIAHTSLRSFLTYIPGVQFFGDNQDDAYILSDTTRPSGSIIRLQFRETEYELTIPAIGRYHGENFLPVYSVAEILGIDLNTITDIARHAVPEPGRSRIFTP